MITFSRVVRQSAALARVHRARVLRPSSIATLPQRVPAWSHSATTTIPVHNFSTATAGSESAEDYSFQAETSQLLDIVTHSLYTDKEVFLRELVSNASDALEKLRHIQTSGVDIVDAGKPLEIKITTDKEAGTLTIEDSGIGLSKQEMVDHLGTIARSGSKAFLENAKADAAGDSSAQVQSSIIGQFGVGFYSAFMVGSKVEVISRSAVMPETGESEVHKWTSEGVGSYSITKLDGSEPDLAELRGSRIVIHLRDDQKEYSNPDRVKEVIKRYSNFVSFPIQLNENVVNTMEAIWMQDPSTVSEEKYTEFYKFSSNAFDEPSLRVHFRTDSPIDLKTLIFIPSFHTEKYGMERMKPGVSLYSRKVLLEANSDKLLPNWLRFARGVVDSEDLPLSISRENMQDSALLKRINRSVTKKIINAFRDTAKKDKAKYDVFYKEFGQFLKEGVCTDFENQEAIAKLVRFSSSNLGPDEITSFDEYISRLQPSQDKIYYLSAPTRELALASPYYEVFKANKVEVLFLHHTLDDFVMSNLGKYNGRDLVAAESGLDLEIKKDESNDSSDEKSSSSDSTPLSTDDAGKLAEWMTETLSDHVLDVKTTSRLVDSPAIVVDHESASLRRMMKMVNAEAGETNPFLAKQKMEINIKHPIIKAINELRNTKPQVAATISRQVFDNALIAAGLVDDPREMVPRLNDLLVTLIKSSQDCGDDDIKQG